MTVIAFTPRDEFSAGGWTSEEFRRLEAIYAARAQRGDASEFAVAATEIGDPQFFLLGTAPGYECVLSISRVSGRYVVEDGNGGVIGEMAAIEEVERVAARLRFRRVRTGLAARIVFAWYAFREFVEEKVEPIVGEMAEVTEVVTHVLPQVAALA
jgi:hypothetical protein